MEQTNYTGLLYLDERYSDVDILVKTKINTWRFPAHKLILSLASDVFARMFSYNFEEDSTGSVTIEDTNPDVIFKVLRYIYLGDVQLENWNEACEILQTAHKYSLMPLLKECEEYLIGALTLRNVCCIFSVANLYDLKELKVECLSLCESGAFVVLKTKGFLTLDVDAVKQIISLTDLNVASELDVLLTLWDWAKLSCCRQQIPLTEEGITDEFLPFLEHVRFESLSDADLSWLPKSAFAIALKKKQQILCENDEKQCNEGKNCPIMDENDEGSTDSYVEVKSVNPLQVSSLFYSKSKFTLHSASEEEKIQGASSISVFRFAVTTNAYLVDIKFISFEDDHKTSYIKRIALVSKDQTVAEWSADEEVHLTFESIEESNGEAEFLFTAKGLLLLKTGQEYNLELCPVNQCPKQCEICWPRTQFVKTEERFESQRVEMRIYSSYTWGVYGMTFLRA